MLERKDVQVGDLLIGKFQNSLKIFPKIGKIYLVVDLNGYGKNGIWLICPEAGRKFHCEAPYFEKADKNCP